MNKSIESLIHGSSGGGSSIIGGNISSERQSFEDVDVPESAETATATTTADDAGLQEADGEMYANNYGDVLTDDNNQQQQQRNLTTTNLRRRKGKIISCAKETFEHASRQLRRKVPYAGHLMTPRRLWLNKIPTQCDVVIEFPEDAPDEALRWLLSRLRTQPPAGLGLVVQVKAHESMRRNAFYVSAPTNVLFKAAEEARLPKRLRPDLGGALREFTTRESHCFQQLKTDDGSTALFTSQERQWLVLQILTGLRAGQTDIEALQGRAAVAEGQSIIAAWQETGLIMQVFPLHEPRSLTQLQTNWVKQIFAPQPLDDIAEYFGVKVALYFAWLGHYTCALGVPAVFGTILYIILWGKGQTAQDMGHVLFSLFNVAWASLYLEAWKRYSVELAFRWGTLSTPPELLEPPRPLYKGPLVENNVTGRLEPKEAPAWKRRAFRYFVSFPIIGLCLLLVFVVMFLMLRFQVLTVLRFYATGCFQRPIGEQWGISMSQPTISRCIHKVTDAINGYMFRPNIRFPMNQIERQAAKETFASASSSFVGGAIGAIDCTHISIMGPKKNEEAYVNHHGYHSINVQMDWLDHNKIPDRGLVQCMYNLHKDWWDSKLPEDSIVCCLSVIPKVLLAGAITLMDEAYYKLAVWLNDRENYRLQSKYENHLIAKVALFQFVNSFLSLFYIAFYLRDEEKLKEQLAGLLISRQIIGNLRESALPYFMEQLKLAKLSFNMWGALSPTQNINRTIMDMTTTNEATGKDETSTTISQQDGSNGGSATLSTTKTTTTSRNISQAEIESSLYKYDGTFSDHLEMLVQMGYVVLFSAAFPLAGVCALINNLMEIRSDAFKLAHVHQRPFGQRVANIGTWQNALSILSLAAVIVNCALIGLSGQVSRLWPGLTTAQTIILIVTLEHIMLGLRSALTWLLPELPSWLAAEIARAEHCRREMQCKGTSPRPTPPTPPSTTSTQPEQDIIMNTVASVGVGTARGIITKTNDQACGSQLADELYYQQQLQGLDFADEISQFGLQRNIEADVNIFENIDSSPDSPPSQTSTILIRPLHESTPPTSGASLTSLNQDLSHGPSGACKSCKQKKKFPEIPAFRGYSVRNLSSIPNQRLHAFAGASASSASTLALTTRQHPMHISEIPPFRKKSNDSAAGSSTTSNSPQRTSLRPLVGTPPSAKIPDIPPFKPRKVSAESTMHLHMSDKLLAKPHAPEWMSRLKVNDNVNLHRSIDCIAKELQSNTETMDILKPAPSWSNVALKTTSTSQPQQQQQIVASSSTSSSGGVASDKGSSAGSSSNRTVTGTEAASTSRPSVGGISTTSNTSQSEKQQQETTATASTSGPKNSIGNSDDEAKAAELAAKKSRLKQKLVKSARSVAIFSLKLKERRQREAEKAAAIAIEHAKQLAKMPPMPQPGGELSLIPIEQLIEIEDIKPTTPKVPSEQCSSTPTTSSTSTMAQSLSSSNYYQHHYHPSSGHY